MKGYKALLTSGKELGTGGFNVKKCSIILAITFLSLIASSASPTQNQRLALLIGNSNYTHGGCLDNPVNDVRAIKKALEDLGFIVMKHEDCTQKAMKRAMDKFGQKLKGKDVGLFFYAGHGVQVGGRNYLLPVDAKLDLQNDVEYDCVRADRILAKMEGAGTKTNIVILDACRDNPFERSWHRRSKTTGLAFMNAPSGSLIAYSTAPGKIASDGEGVHSPYTFALLEHIGTPNITILRMFQKVRSTVRNISGNRQTPWESTSLSGDFFFKDQRRKNDEVQKETKNNQSYSRLFVSTKPEGSRIRILNIKPKFHQGIKLKSGSYHLEVSAPGYKTTKKWVLLDDNDKTLIFELGTNTVEKEKKILKVKQLQDEKRDRILRTKEKVRSIKEDIANIDTEIDQAKRERYEKQMRAKEWYNGVLAEIRRIAGGSPSYEGIFDRQTLANLSNMDQQNQQLQMLALMQAKQKYDSILQQIDSEYKMRTDRLTQRKLILSEQLFDLLSKSADLAE